MIWVNLADWDHCVRCFRVINIFLLQYTRQKKRKRYNYKQYTFFTLLITINMVIYMLVHASFSTFFKLTSHIVFNLHLHLPRHVQVRREGPGAGFGFTLSGSSPVFIKTVDRGKFHQHVLTSE